MVLVIIWSAFVYHNLCCIISIAKKKNKNKKKANSLAAENTEATAKAPAKHASTLHALEYETQRLRDSRLCKQCKSNEVNVVFLPCGHLICCDQCAVMIKKCLMCQTTVANTVKTYLS